MQEWFDKATGKVLSLFSHKEVKTPLSFFFRIASVLITLLLGTLYWVGPDSQLRFKVFEIGVGFRRNKFRRSPCGRIIDDAIPA